MGSPILSGGMWSGFTSLSHRSMGVLMYPLQLLTGKTPLAAPLATITQLASPNGRPTPTTPLPTVMETPEPPMGAK